MKSSSSIPPSELGRRERRRWHNREALVAAARRVMADVGFERATINAITEAADLGFGTFYQYFRSKEDALDAVVDEALQDMLARLCPDDVATLPPPAALAAVARRFAEASVAHRDVLRIVFRHGPLSLAPLLRFRDAFVEQLEAVIVRGATSGEFAVSDPALAARALAGLYVQGLLWRAETRRADRSGSDLIDILTALALGGLRGGAP